MKSITKVELNQYLKEHTKIPKIDIKSLGKVAKKTTIDEYVKKFEGLMPNSSYEGRMIREYVDQILNKDIDDKISNFIVKLRDIYFKKKEREPLKAKKRFVVGIKEVEKFLKLEYAKCVFIIPNLEKVLIEDEINPQESKCISSTIEEIDEQVDEDHHDKESSDDEKKENKPSVVNTKFFANIKTSSSNLDERLKTIIWHCRRSKIPFYFCLNKFKLGKACRKKNSTVSMAAIVNVEGLEPEFKNLMEDCSVYRTKFYGTYKKEDFIGNEFIDLSQFLPPGSTNEEITPNLVL